MSKHTFRFLAYEYDEATSQVTLRYCFDDGVFFEEQITFQKAPQSLSKQQHAALDVCLRHLHLAAGVSYYKAYAPADIIIETGNLSIEEAHFFESFYINGLAEFAYKNDLDLRDKIIFPSSSEAYPTPSDLDLTKLTAVPVGGGKDSIVSIELLKKGGENIVLFSLGNSVQIQKVIEATGLPNINVTRKLSDQLFKLNQQKKTLNGHVPITGILSFIAITAAVIYDFDTIIMSNEQSANEGNLISDGFKINHQYSKSLEFELAFQKHINTSVLKNISYFSLLRPLSELAITSIFSSLKKYHPVFVSCNRAYTIRKEDRINGWCGECPKCRFVFLALAPFLDKNEVVDIFGKDLLNDPAQEQGYRELLGLQGHKPFECVGEISESRAALKQINLIEAWQSSLLVNKLSPEVIRQTKDSDANMSDFLVINELYKLPKHYQKQLNEFTESTWKKNSYLGNG